MSAGPPSFCVRSAHQADIPLIASLEAALFPDAWSAESLRRYASTGAGSTGSAACVAEPSPAAAGEAEIVPPATLAGYLLCSWVLDEATIERVGVASACRRMGVGWALVEHATRVLGERGVRQLWLEVAASNAGAIKLYERAGFRTVSIRRRYYAGPPPDDALVMNKVIA